MMRYLIFLLVWLPCTAVAQGAANLIADSVSLNAENQLLALGNVEVFFEGSRMTAHQIIYDRPSDTLRITGPVFITTADGTVLTATTATMDPRLENGILLGARIVLDQQLQLAANQIDREGGRYTQLYKSAATACRVCGTGPPLWEIRAERVIHDRLERQLYFQNATFHLRGVPVFWLPRMRLPDPSLERARGFLIPEPTSTSELKTGIKIPYFIPLGDHRDMTVTPYLSPETRTLELRYRQAFLRGNLNIDGAISEDNLQDGLRSYLFATANFTLPRDLQLAFDIETASDRSYLREYDYSSKDRLDSAIRLLRVRDRALSQTRLIRYRTLRIGEENASLPPIIADIGHETRFNPAFGGTLRMRSDLDVVYRNTSADGDAGRDVIRTGMGAEWSNTALLPLGLVALAKTGLQADGYLVDDDSRFAANDLRIVPKTQVILRWPFSRQAVNGNTHVIEPVISLTWAERYGALPPNEDSTRSELDRANLIDLSRFAGEDAVETGFQTAAGVNWTYANTGGTVTTLGAGRVFRETAQNGFTASSGLDGVQSDWLLSAQINTPRGFLIDARSFWDVDDGLTVADSRIRWSNAAVSLNGNYVWQNSDPDESRDDIVSEWTVGSAIRLNTDWSLNISGRYDLADDRPLRADLELRWRNECISLDLSASRDYTTSQVDPSTSFGIRGSIDGFSAGRGIGGAAARCRNESR